MPAAALRPLRLERAEFPLALEVPGLTPLAAALLHYAPAPRRHTRPAHPPRAAAVARAHARALRLALTDPARWPTTRWWRSSTWVADALYLADPTPMERAVLHAHPAPGVQSWLVDTECDVARLTAVLARPFEPGQALAGSLQHTALLRLVNLCAIDPATASAAEGALLAHVLTLPPALLDAVGRHAPRSFRHAAARRGDLADPLRFDLLVPEALTPALDPWAADPALEVRLLAPAGALDGSRALLLATLLARHAPGGRHAILRHLTPLPALLAAAAAETPSTLTRVTAILLAAPDRALRLATARALAPRPLGHHPAAPTSAALALHG